MDFCEGHTVGIDLGTSFSSLAQFDTDGAPQPVANREGDTQMPSLVLLSEGGQVMVGPSRIRAAMEASEKVVDSVKRHMGDSRYERTFNDKPTTPEFVSALILTKLRRDARRQIGTIGNVVLAVPYSFNDRRRKATQDAGLVARMNVIDIINEPVAAALAYARSRGELGKQNEDDVPRKVLVYDLGGGTFDVTVIEYTPTNFRVIATDGDPELGGIDFSERIVDRVVEAYQKKHGADIREMPEIIQMLRIDCDLAKIQLSERPEATVTSRVEGESLSVKITREKFESMTADLLEHTRKLTERVLHAAGTTVDEIDGVILSGGATLMPQVTAMIEDLTGQKPYEGISPTTAVVEGAAIHAAILEAKHRGADCPLADDVRASLAAVEQQNVNSHGLGMAVPDPETRREVNHLMIPKNTPLPHAVTKKFVTQKDGQDHVSVLLIEGDARDAKACSLLGKCRIGSLPPELTKGSPIEATYSINESGRVVVAAVETTNGTEATIEIKRPGGLAERQIRAYAKLAQSYELK